MADPFGQAVPDREPASAQEAIQRVRTFWDDRPCNSRYSPKPLGTKEYFDEVEARKHFVEPHIPRFAEFDRWRGKKVLEIGCGIGTDTVNFARRGATVTAVELSEKSLEIARQQTQVYGLQDRIRFYGGNAEKLSSFLPAEPYDLIYSFGVIHHSPHPDKIFRQLRAYTHPGTTIKIMLYHRHSWKVFWILCTYGRGCFWKWKELIPRYSEAQIGCPVTFTYSPREVRELLGFAGFQVVKIDVAHIFPYQIEAYRKYRYKKEWYFALMPASLFRWLESHFGWHLCITAKP